MGDAASHDIIKRRHPLEQSNILEGARRALLGDLIRFHRSALFTMKEDFAFLRMVKPVDDIQHRGFSSAIGADNRTNFAFAYIKRNIFNRHNTPKAQSDFFHLHDDATDLATICGGVAVLGLNCLCHSAATFCTGVCTAASRIVKRAEIVPLRPSS